MCKKRRDFEANKNSASDGRKCRARRHARHRRVWRRRRRRRREDAQPDDRRHRAADRRPVGLRPSGPQGRGPGGRSDQRGGEGGRRRPHGQDRPRGRPDRSAGRRAGGPQGRGPDNASCIAGGYSSTSSTIPIARSVSIREGVLQLSPASTADEISGLEDDGLLNRTSPPDRFQGPTLAGLVEDSLGGAQGKTINIAARNDAYGTGLADTFTKPWEAKGGQIGERVIYDPEQPSYNSEAQQIVSGNPDGWVIIDFPETYAKVGPALVRTGNWDPKKSFITDGLASSELPKDVGRDATEGMRGTAPGSPDSGAASQAFDKAVLGRAGALSARRSTRRTSTPRSCATWRRWPPAARTERRWPRSCRTSPARAATSTRSSSCPTRSRRCRTATTSTTRVPPGPIDLNERRRPDVGRVRHLPLQGRQDRRVRRAAGRGATDLTTSR